MKNASLLFALCVLLSGCVTWPSEYNGVSIDDIQARSTQACRKSRHSKCDRLNMPHSCFVVMRNHDLTYESLESDIDKAWAKCLVDLSKYEQQADKIYSQHIEKLEVEKKLQQQIELDRQRIKQERQKYGYDFIELYTIAVTNGAESANNLLKKYGGRVYIHPLLVLNYCRTGICQLEIEPSAGGEGFGFDMMSRGIWGEPGTRLSQFKLLHFEEYGQGLFRNPVAVFTRR